MRNLHDPARKVNFADLSEIVPWLVPNLKDAWPDLSEDGVVHWLKAATSDPLACFLRTPRVVGLFHAQRTVLDPRPEVTEQFVRAREPSNEEAVLLYKAARDWAVSIRARALRFNFDSDSPMTQWIVPAVEGAKKEVKVRKHSVYLAVL